MGQSAVNAANPHPGEASSADRDRRGNALFVVGAKQVPGAAAQFLRDERVTVYEALARDAQ